MTTIELLAELARECPNGVSFEPLAVRLLRQKIPLEDGQIENLKAAMFQMGNGLWFSREMISCRESLSAFEGQARAWLQYGCFSIERLFDNFRDALCHINTPDACAVFLRHLGFSTTAWGKVGLFCFAPPNLDAGLAALVETIAGRLEEAGGILSVNEIEETMPYLAAEALERIRAHFLPEVHMAMIGGIPCWRCMKAIILPEDFSEKLTDIVDTLDELQEKVSAANVEFALNLFYRTRFREEYALTDNDAFMRVCARHYQGKSDIFSNFKTTRAKTNGVSAPNKRMRSPNTRFGNIGVPIGAELVFTKDSRYTCLVLDDINQVEYNGKTFAISALANNLLGVDYSNGFSFFSYEGETLWERRLRLEAIERQEESDNTALPHSLEAQRAEGEIIGLEGHPLSPATWQAFKRAGTTPRIADWTRRVANGENVENIASESGLHVSTVKEYILNRHRYFDVCRKNNIVPEGGTNV
jgi:hypothetical protein